MRPWPPVLIWAILLAALPADASDQSRFAYIYIESNTGTSSGGHIAAALGNNVYHFENHSGRLLLTRDSWISFKHLYSDLENRSMYVAEVPVPLADFQRIEHHLTHILLEQQANLFRLKSFEMDVAVLESLANHSPLMVDGMGLSVQAAESAKNFSSSIEKTFQRDPGEAFLLEKLAAVTQSQEQLLKNKNSFSYSAPKNSSIFSPSFSDRWLGLIQMKRAIQTLLGKYSIQEELLTDGGPLSDWSGVKENEGCSGSDWLSNYQRQEIESIKQRLKGPLPISGLPLLRSIARLQAATLSLQRNRLLFIRPSSSEPGGILPEQAFHPELQDLLAKDTLANAQQVAYSLFCLKEPDEILLHKMEVAISELQEVRRANLEKRPVRIFPEPILQEGPGKAEVWIDQPSQRPNEEQIQQASDTSLKFDQELSDRYRYDLIQRNCVTVLLDSINGSFDHGDETRAFGGHIDPHLSQAFIPYRFFQLVKNRYKIRPIELVPSLRGRWLKRLQGHDIKDWEWMKEQTALSSRIYSPRAEDGYFLFFTDHIIAPLRPPAGVINLGYGMGASLLGFAAWPFDDGSLITSGGKGILFSLPEIFGWNIRKGSFSELGIRKIEESESGLVMTPPDHLDPAAPGLP